MCRDAGTYFRTGLIQSIQPQVMKNSESQLSIRRDPALPLIGPALERMSHLRRTSIWAVDERSDGAMPHVREPANGPMRRPDPRLAKGDPLVRHSEGGYRSGDMLARPPQTKARPTLRNASAKPMGVRDDSRSTIPMPDSLRPKRSL